MEARERSIQGCAALCVLERRQSSLSSTKEAAFSWWPGQESEVFHTQTRLSGNREGLLVEMGEYDNLM
eukprot:2508706-Prorocentrum_lima.AAC.1